VLDWIVTREIKKGEVLINTEGERENDGWKRERR